MQVKRNSELANRQFPVRHGGTTIDVGALLMPGVTADTDLGVGIRASGAGADAFGVLRAQLASTTTDTAVAGTSWNLREVTPVAPMRVLEVEIDQADTMAVASTSTTTVTITSLEDNIDTSWLYAVGGTGIGSLYYLSSSASGSATSKTATGWDSTTTCIKLLRIFHQLAKLNTTADKFGTDAAAGSYTCVILGTCMRSGAQKFYLDPTQHNGLTGLNQALLGTKFFSDVCVRNGTPYTID